MMALFLLAGAHGARAQDCSSDPCADLVMNKSAPASAAANTDITYTLNLLNIGPNDATSVQVTDPLPPGVTFVSLSAPPGWICTNPAVGNNGNVVCDNALVPNGANVAFTIVGHIAPATAPGTALTNVATVASAVDPTDENNSATAVTFVSGGTSADLAVSKNGPLTIAANQDVTYSIPVNNAGPDAASTVSLSDPLPATMTFVSLTAPAGWSCTTPAVGANGTVTCTIPTLPVGPAGTFTLVAHVPPGTPDGTEFINTATITAATFDPATENNTASIDTTVVPAQIDLVITKNHAGSAFQGQTGFAYTIAVTNVGTAASTGTVTVTDTLPAGLTAAAIVGTGWTCTLATTTCTRADALVAGASYPPITLTVNVAANAATTVTNTATVSGGGDVNAANNTATDPTTVTPGPEPDLAIAKTHTGNATQGQAGFAYTITVRNAGSGPTTAPVTVSDTVPAGLTAAAISGAGWTCAVGATSTCTRADALAVGASYPPITLTVNVAANAPGSVTNTATVSGGGETNTANNTASDPTIVATNAPIDLAITKTHAGTPRQGQQNFPYAITVSNVGTAPSAGTVTVTDVLPAGMTAVAMSGPGWTCTAASATCTRADALSPGAAYPQISFIVNVAPDAAASLTNVAIVAGGGDGNAANNVANDVTAVRARPDPSKDPDVIGLVSAQIAAAERFTNTQISNFNERLENLHDDTTGDDHQGIQFGSADTTPRSVVQVPVNPLDRNCTQNCALASADPTAVDPAAASPALAYAGGGRAGRDPLVTKAPQPLGAPERNLHFWSTGFVSFGSADPTFQRSGVDFTTSGVSAGLDYRFSRSFVAGIGVGYGRDWSNIGVNGTRSDAEAANVSVYGSYKPWRDVFIDGVGGIGALRFDSRRFVVEDADFVFGSRNGSQVFGSLTAGYEFKRDGFLLSPYARINAAWITLDAFTETGGVGGALNFSDQSANFVTSVLGLRGRYTMLTPWGVFTPRFRVEYNHDFNNSSSVSLRYADFITGPVFGLSVSPAERDRVTLGLGSDLAFSDALRLGADYQYNNDFLGAAWHTFKLKLQSRF